MHDHSFEFEGSDMYTLYGIRVRNRHEVLKPPLRPRKVVVPSRDGAYDYGARNYEERTLLVECDTVTELTKAERRELSYLLSKKGTIKFWDETDKYYTGRIYDASEIEKVGGIGTYFPLTFICDPFLYGGKWIIMGGGGYPVGTENVYTITPTYNGTAEAPLNIKISNNTGNVNSHIQIAIKKRRE